MSIYCVTYPYNLNLIIRVFLVLSLHKNTISVKGLPRVRGLVFADMTSFVILTPCSLMKVLDDSCLDSNLVCRLKGAYKLPLQT